MRIDVHAHLWTDEYLDLLDSFGRDDTGTQRDTGAGATPGELEARFALNDSAGIAHQVLSVSPQVPHFAERRHAVTAARFANDLYADVVAAHPERFSAFAALPLPHVDDALVELTRALDDLGMVGVAVTTDVLGTTLADPAFAPVLAELDRRGSVLYVHPSGHDADTPLIGEHRMRWMVGAPMEDTIAVMHMILAGVPAAYPRLRIINSHLGGALPMLLQRADNQYQWESPGTPEKPSVAARRMWFDTVSHGHVPALRAAAESFGADRLVLGTDFPYQSGDLLRRAVTSVQDALSADDAAAVLDRNAAELFGRH
ncbi:amidohydrolase family protein [Yinghuangia seranimata]|uniref:amidohydrolase family protein n=1 Tax=Yinghuangia seranimata TaxID=408067 RepID=UPI00248B1949|nr:amidohydrolase family protein [Yinghuangia seranimata]MDI2127558.1 amidohydrolase family protein [Yinghuangia seranimata]